MIGPKASVTHPGQLNIAGGALSTITDLKMEGKLTELHRPYLSLERDGKGNPSQSYISTYGVAVVLASFTMT